MSFKIIIADDHKMFRNGLKLMIETNKVGTVIGEAENGQQFIDLLENLQPDIVLMDIEMPVMNGIVATQKAVEKYPDIKILALSMYDDEKFYYKMLNAGAKGFLLKNSGTSELIAGIKEVANNEVFFSNELLRKIIIKLGSQETDNKKSILPDFTEREMEILQLVCKGLSTFEIAEEISLSPKTIDSYRSKLITKTNSKNTVSLVVYAIKNGLVSLSV